MAINLDKKAPIKIQVEVLLVDEVPTAVTVEYFDYSNIFLVKKTI